MKFTDEQKELLALLPQELKNSQKLTDSAKLVLSNIIFLYGMEDAQKNGYVFRSYDDLMKDTFIQSRTSISKAIALLVQKEYIKVKSGRLKDRKANEFTLLDNALLNKKCTEKCTDKCTLNDYWTNKIESLENEIVLLKKEIDELKKCTNKCTEKCTVKNEKCTEKCTTETDTDSDIDNDITTGILDMKDLGTKVNEVKENKKEKVNEMKNAVLSEMKLKDNETETSTSDDQNKNEVKVSSPKVRPSSKIEDNNTGGKAYIPKNFEVNSPTSPSDDDMSFDEYTEYDLRKRGLTSNKATGDVETRSMEQLSTNGIKTQPDAKEVAQTEREAKIASIMTNIELDKDGMLKAKNQMQFDASFADLKNSLANLKHLVSDEAYENYRSTQVNWWKATVKYLVWYKDTSKKPTKPTVEQMGNYQYHLDSMRIAQKIEDMENALNRIENWFEKMEQLYTKTVMQQYWQKFESDCASVKRSNPIFEEWQKKMRQTA